MDLNGAGSMIRGAAAVADLPQPGRAQVVRRERRAGELASGSLKIDWDAAAFAAVLAKQAPPAESVDGHFALRDASVTLLPGLPDDYRPRRHRHDHRPLFPGLRAARGDGLGDGRKLNGADLSFTVPDTAPAPRVAANGGAHILGSADALADLLTHDALKKYVGVALDPATIKGQFQGDLKLDLTLGKGVQPEEQKFSRRRRAQRSLRSTSSSATPSSSRRRSTSPPTATGQDVGQRIGVRRPGEARSQQGGAGRRRADVTGTLDEAARASSASTPARASGGRWRSS